MSMVDVFWMLVGAVWGYLVWILGWLHSHRFVEIIDTQLAANLGIRMTNFLPGWLLWVLIGVGLGKLVSLVASSAPQKF